MVEREKEKEVQRTNITALRNTSYIGILEANVPNGPEATQTRARTAIHSENGITS